LCVKDNNLFAGAINGIYRSTDNGATFQRTLNGFPTNIGVTAYALTTTGGNVAAAVNVSFTPSQGLAGIFYSSDDGSNWHQASLPITPTAVTSIASDGSSLAYASLFGQNFSVKGLYKSTDAGITWTQRQALNVDIERLAANGSNVLAGDLFTAYYSTDFGESWNSSAPPGNCPFGCGIFTYTFSGSSVFAGNEEGMFLSVDRGASWTPINEGFPQCPSPDVEASCADNDYLFAGTFGDGAWRKALGPTPTPTPSPTVTVTPSPTPSATATVSPSPTATPSATGTPSSTPRPTVTPRPRATPRVRPTPAPRP
jgi:cell division septation protein DedD